MSLIRNLLSLLLVAILCAACAPAEQATNLPQTRIPTPPSSVAGPTGVTKAPGCTVTSHQTTPDPTLQALLPPPTGKDWINGAKNASVTIIEYGDFQ